MKTILYAIHIIAAIALTFLILLHSGQKGGLSGLFTGGGMATPFSGSSMMEKNLNRITVALGIVFVITTVFLLRYYFRV